MLFLKTKSRSPKSNHLKVCPNDISNFGKKKYGIKYSKS